VIGSDRFQVLMHRTCSGFEGVGLITVFVVAYLLIARRELRFPQALLLLPLGIAASLAANVVRIVALILVGTSISPAVAAGGFHARAGWLFFSALALSLVLLSQRLRFFAHEPTVPSLQPSDGRVPPAVPDTRCGGAAHRPDERKSRPAVRRAYRRRRPRAAGLPALLSRYRRRISWSAVVAGLLAAAAFIGLSPRPDAESMRMWQEEWQALPSLSRYSWTLVRAVGSVLVVPIAEELAFRGYLLRRLAAPAFETVSPGQVPVWALLISSAAFGAIHAGWLGASIAGLLFGIVQMRSNSIMQAIWAHTFSNAAVAVYVLGFGEWWLWM
jgi:CAAX prenyl protease-like protein